MLICEIIGLFVTVKKCEEANFREYEKYRLVSSISRGDPITFRSELAKSGITLSIF